MCDPTNDPERRETWNNQDLYSESKTTTEEMYSILNAGKIEKDIVVDHPPHYCNRKMEAIDIVEMIIEVEQNPKVAYSMSNVLKYLLRFRDKGTPIRDLQKAEWYLHRMIEKIKEESE